MRLNRDTCSLDISILISRFWEFDIE